MARGGHCTAKTVTRRKFSFVLLFTRDMPGVTCCGEILIFAIGARATTQHLKNIFNVFSLAVCRSTAAKPNDIDITFLQHFLLLRTLKITSIATYTCARWTNQPVLSILLVPLYTVLQNGAAGIYSPPARRPQT